MAIGIVDRLEAIQIEEHHDHHAGAAFGALQCMRQQFHQLAPINQAGQLIVGGQLLQLCRLLFQLDGAFGDAPFERLVGSLQTLVDLCNQQYQQYAGIGEQVAAITLLVVECLNKYVVQRAAERIHADHGWRGGDVGDQLVFNNALAQDGARMPQHLLQPLPHIGRIGLLIFFDLVDRGDGLFAQGRIRRQVKAQDHGQQIVDLVAHRVEQLALQRRAAGAGAD